MKDITTEEVDRRFGLLKHYSRRCVIRLLQQADGDSVTVNEVVRHLQRQGSTIDDREQILISLRHNHLGILDEIDAINFDADEGRIEYNGDKLVDSILGVVSEPYETSRRV